jgi:hypothetical protein
MSEGVGSCCDSMCCIVAEGENGCNENSEGTGGTGLRVRRPVAPRMVRCLVREGGGIYAAAMANGRGVFVLICGEIRGG